MAKYRTNTDWNKATETTDAGKAAFIQWMTPVDAAGSVIGSSNPTTGTQTTVASQTGTISLLASNTNRKGATIANTDANALYVLLGTGTASATNFTATVAPNGYYEVPYGYTGAIQGAWAADGAGSALITELT